MSTHDHTKLPVPVHANTTPADLQQMMYRDQPVVTFQMVADVHGVTLNTVRESFRRNRERFEEGRHFYHLSFQEVSSLPLSVAANSQGLTVLTERGYLLLVKPMRDDTSWQVQERMVEDYFRLRAIVLPALTPAEALLRQAQLMVEQERRLALVEAKVAHVIDNEARFTIEEYVVSRRLRAKMPERLWQPYGTHLTKYCELRGIDCKPIPVAGKIWKDEHEYPESVFQATFASWLFGINGQSVL